MRTPSGLLHVVDFKTDQIISAIQPKDYWADNRHWEIKITLIYLILQLLTALHMQLHYNSRTWF
ncbi:prophage LambdaBa01, minor structural protein [Bacillus thuringiensis serovar kurstaki str. HD-1]|nr:prophage LambdaBa01, minor structural protein [Bacillus thuringiensis serovar kurstaki str. HD-1]